MCKCLLGYFPIICNNVRNVGMAGELPISPNIGSAVVFIIATLGLECLYMCRWNVHWYIERKRLNILVDSCQEVIITNVNN